MEAHPDDGPRFILHTMSKKYRCQTKCSALLEELKEGLKSTCFSCFQELNDLKITIFIHPRLFHIHCTVNTILCCAVVSFNDTGCCWVETALKILRYLFVVTAFCVLPILKLESH